MHLFKNCSFLSNKIIYNINMLNGNYLWYWVCGHGGLENLELPTVSIVAIIKTQE
jgi:hypothetical protein